VEIFIKTLATTCIVVILNIIYEKISNSEIDYQQIAKSSIMFLVALLVFNLVKKYLSR